MPNPNSVLILNPEFDLATSFTHHWTNEVINEAQQLGLNVVVLDGDEARLPQFESIIENNDPLFIYGAGHGSEEIFTGQNQENILWVPTNYPGHEHADSNVNLVRERVTYLLSCLTAQALGPAIAAQPNTYYIGYREDFVFTGFTPGDKYSESFKAGTNEIAKSLLRGKTIIEAYNAGIAKFDEEIIKWQQSFDSSAPFVVSALLHNRDVLVAIGAGIPPQPAEITVRPPLMEMLTSGYGIIISLALI